MLNVADLIENNGKTWRENNMTQKHNIPIGTLVQIIDTEERLHVMDHGRDCDGTPLYTLGVTDSHQMSWQTGYGEESLIPIYKAVGKNHFHARSMAVTLTRSITTEEAYRLALESGQIHEAIRQVSDVAWEYCYTDSHGLPLQCNESDGWTPSSITFPTVVSKCEALDDGIIDSIKKYEAVFHKNDVLLKIDDSKRISVKEFMCWQAACAQNLNNYHFGTEFAKYVGSQDLRLTKYDTTKAYWYIMSNYIDFNLN